MGVTTVRLQPDLEASLEALATKLQRSKSWLINQSLREFIDREQEAESRWRETLEAIDAIRDGRALSGDSVHGWLRTWGTADEQRAPKGAE